MRVLVLGGDGYLGWPTAMHFSARGHEVYVVDNYLRRNIARETCSEPLMRNPNLHERAEIFQALSGKKVQVQIADCANYLELEPIVRNFQPEAIIHYAEQPSAPYSMIGFRESQKTLNNNLNTTFNVIWAVIQHALECHIVKLGTMGEYGTPNIDIEEGWIDIHHNGRSDHFLFPRQAGSLYHTTKILDTDLLWFYVRLYDLRVTDLMQGPVYGLETTEAILDVRLLPNFHYDDIFGTVLNRFLVQAVAGIPLTIYGEGGQVRGYINLKDTLQCVELAITNPAQKGELRVLNQFTEQFSVNELASRVQSVASKLHLTVSVQHIKNPRMEKEKHYYNAKHQGFKDMGLQPHLLTDEALHDLLLQISCYRDSVDTRKITPRVSWGG
jgi:UDP-sulfoquinovose synthase